MPPSLMQHTKDCPKVSRTVSLISPTSKPLPSFVTLHWKLTADIGNAMSMTISQTSLKVPIHLPTGPILSTSPTRQSSNSSNNQQSHKGTNNNNGNQKSSNTTKMPDLSSKLRKDGKLLPEECQWCIDQGLCLLCGSKGHWLRSAPSPRWWTPQTPKLALLRQALIPRPKILQQQNQNNNQQPCSHAHFKCHFFHSFKELFSTELDMYQYAWNPLSYTSWLWFFWLFHWITSSAETVINKPKEHVLLLS